MTAQRAVIEQWREHRSGTLRGFAQARMPSGMVIADCKTRYLGIISFSTHALRNAWSDLIVEVLRESHPEAFK